MKKTMILALAAAAFPAAAVAESAAIEPYEGFTGDLRAVTFCKNGQEFLVESFDNERNDIASFTVYDASLAKKWTVNIDTDKEKVIYLDINNSTANLSDSGGVNYFTQTLFNEDEEVEYVVAKKGNGSYPYTGFKIMQANGTCLADIDVEGGINGDATKVGNYVFLGSEENIYKIDRKAFAGSKAVQLVSKSVKAAPNPVKRGEAFRISGISDVAGVTVCVNGLDGTLVKAYACEPGDAAEIPTADLTAGTYVYTLVRAGKAIASGKMIVE